MSDNRSYDFEVAALDKLLKENKITHEEWYALLTMLRQKYSLPCINNINYIDIKSVLRQYTHDGKGSN